MIPATIGRYQIKKELGRGGMATVYHAYDPMFDREVAIKVLPREFLHDPGFRERFKREVKVIAALEHPAIVPVYDLGEEDGAPYYVMRYMPGGSLTTRINQGAVALQDASRIIEKLASAIAYAHKKGVVHRDLKPDNILFDGNGDPYISDFGVASLASSDANLTGHAAIGTPAYMSPEQAQGEKADNRSDIYSLGVIIFQMLSGQQPYKADTPMGTALKQITEPVPEILEVNPRLPREADTVIKMAMAKKREERYSSATDLAKAFDQVAQKQGDVIVIEGPPRRPQPAKEKKYGFLFAVIGIGAIFLLLAVVGIFFIGKLLFSSTTATAPTQSSASQPETAVSSSTATTAAPAAAEFFTEDFSQDLNADWKHFVANGVKDLTPTVQDGIMGFDLAGDGLTYYAYYTAKTYADIRVDARVKNRSGATGSVLLICRYDETKGWYEFKINSGGLYEIRYASLNNDKINTSTARIVNGGSPLIKTGDAVNDYAVTCVGQTLALWVNGSLVKSVDDRRFNLVSGYAGFGATSEKQPAQLGIDSVSSSQP